MPSVAIHTVGAGGGSIGWRDEGGSLRVGPHSSGAVPGPPATARGGAEPDGHRRQRRRREDRPGWHPGRDVADAPGPGATSPSAALGEALGPRPRRGGAGHPDRGRGGDGRRGAPGLGGGGGRPEGGASGRLRRSRRVARHRSRPWPGDGRRGRAFPRRRVLCARPPSQPTAHRPGAEPPPYRRRRRRADRPTSPRCVPTPSTVSPGRAPEPGVGRCPHRRPLPGPVPRAAHPVGGDGESGTSLAARLP